MNYCMLTDEWKNFFERIKPKNEESRKSMMDEISRWASYRGQTARTGKVTNSTERAKLEPKDEFLKARMDEISLWASYRGQTLTRTGKVTNSLVLNERTSILLSNSLFYCASERNDVLQEGA